MIWINSSSLDGPIFKNMAWLRMSKRLAVEGPKELLAITINGQVFVESEEERNR